MFLKIDSNYKNYYKVSKNTIYGFIYLECTIEIAINFVKYLT